MYLSISKLFEKVAYNQVYSYFTTNELFYEGQYGFREKHSTELANMELLERVLSALNDKKLPVSIFMDLSKAFDILDHKILMNKSKYYGINWTPLCWFMSYLSNRTQYVEINNVISSSSTISTGVPQGSILVPLLFFYLYEWPALCIQSVSLNPLCRWYYPFQHNWVLHSFAKFKCQWPIKPGTITSIWVARCQHTLS